MKLTALAALGLGVALSFSAATARADCAAPPSSCYCRQASAVIDGHVESVTGATITVRVDSVTPSSATPAAGSTVTFSEGDFYGALPTAGARVLASYDQSGQPMAPSLIVESDDQVGCDMNRLPVADTTELFLLDDAACRAKVDERFGKYECDDTSSSCRAAPRSPAGSEPAFIGLLVAAGALLARKRRAPR